MSGGYVTKRFGAQRAAVFGALLMGTTALAGVVVPAPALAQTTASTQRPFNIPAQSLREALLIFGQQSGLQVTAQGPLVEGRTSAAVSGTLSPAEALSRLLTGTGLTFRFDGADAVRIEPVPQSADGAIQLGPVRVEGANNGSGDRTTPAPTVGNIVQTEGTATDGYRVRTLTSVGPLGAMAIKDTPYSVSVTPRELIENIQAQSPDDIFKINPYTRMMTPQITGWAPMVSIRGFQTYDRAEDGLRRSFHHAAVVEDKERIEVLGGLSGFLYGASSPGGMINYVYKRPTLDPFRSVTVGNYGGEQYYGHADLGGSIDAQGQLGYRLNLVKQAGDTAVDYQNINRFLASGALDWRITDRLILELNAAYHHYKLRGPSAYWFIRPGVTRGAAPDAGKNWGQPWVRDEFETVKLMAKLSYQLSDHVTLRGAYGWDDVDRPVQDHTQNSVRATDAYYQIRIRSGRTRDRNQAANLLADFDFDTGPLSHKVTLGYFGYWSKSWSTTYSPNTTYLGPYPRSEPTYVPEPAFPADTSTPYYSGRGRNDNYVVGDQISIGNQVTAIVGVSRSEIFDRSLDTTGALSRADYKKGRWSPTVALTYKPLPWLTAYASYIEGLETGGVAPLTAANAREIMPPMVSRQKEIGVKAELGGLLLTGALFDISKAYELLTDDNLYTQDGRQKHRGIEFSATGRLTNNLTIVGGFTALDADVDGGDYDGLKPINVAGNWAKLYLEYDLPFVPGLTLTGGVYRTDKQWGNAVNTDRLPAYTTFDLGARYSVPIGDKALSLRVTVNNVADKSYWQNAYYVGLPRSVAFSAQFQF
ncbi:TonB-dependent receptor [Novosphingobium resinovorum]|uniref:TonB-dependent receptor n=1 Tax=Novosphingobium resinovorum TaxID=158500 RepID=UPI002ED5E498|nr:TonB-dependent receptor [Novosphingobium resinovorum]